MSLTLIKGGGIIVDMEPKRASGRTSWSASWISGMRRFWSEHETRGRAARPGLVYGTTCHVPHAQARLLLLRSVRCVGELSFACELGLGLSSRFAWALMDFLVARP